ncbi:Asx homology domain containing protein [Naviculisporaceae sp. PSN 640]
MANNPPQQGTTGDIPSSSSLSSPSGSAHNDGSPVLGEEARESSEGLRGAPSTRRKLPTAPPRKRKSDDKVAEEAQEVQTEETGHRPEDEATPTSQDGEHDSNNGSEQPGRKRRKISETRQPATSGSGTRIKLISGSKKRAAMSAAKHRSNKKWEAPFVYTDERSPLVGVNLRDLLLLPEAWDILTPEEKQDILALFPEDTAILNEGTEDARPDTTALKNSDHFRYDCARYTDNIKEGFHDEDWLLEAWVAHDRHKRGEFDRYLRETFESEWDVELPREGSASSQERSSEERASTQPNSEFHLRSSDSLLRLMREGGLWPSSNDRPTPQGGSSSNIDRAGSSSNIAIIDIADRSSNIAAIDIVVSSSNIADNDRAGSMAATNRSPSESVSLPSLPSLPSKPAGASGLTQPTEEGEGSNSDNDGAASVAVTNGDAPASPSAPPKPVEANKTAPAPRTSARKSQAPRTASPLAVMTKAQPKAKATPKRTTRKAQTPGPVATTTQVK